MGTSGAATEATSTESSTNTALGALLEDACTMATPSTRRPFEMKSAPGRALVRSGDRVFETLPLDLSAIANMQWHAGMTPVERSRRDS